MAVCIMLVNKASWQFPSQRKSQNVPPSLLEYNDCKYLLSSLTKIWSFLSMKDLRTGHSPLAGLALSILLSLGPRATESLELYPLTSKVQIDGSSFPNKTK
jgi:hypothetical protein